MKTNWEDDYEIPDEIDLSTKTWVRNPFVQDFRELNLVSLDPDVKAAFPDSDAVNTALRLLMRVAREAGTNELPKAS